jgi:succinyl-diaminopimelate desuccinylase
MAFRSNEERSMTDERNRSGTRSHDRREFDARTISLLKDLIRIPSVNPPGNERSVAERLADELRAAGVEVELRDVLPGRPNLVARLGSGRSPHLWLNGHLDTVGIGEPEDWTHDPFAAEEVDGRIYGRGATDDKGGIAALVGGLLAVRRRDQPLAGTVSLTAVMGEEAGNIGTRALIASGFRADLAIVGEYSGARRIAAGYRGCLWLTVTTRGRAAHGSRPHEGVNAVDSMTETVLPALRRLEFEYEEALEFLVTSPTVSVNTIRGGRAVNVIPDSCSAEIDVRLVPGQRTGDALAAVRRALDACDGVPYSVEVLQSAEPFWTDTNTELVRSVRASIRDVLGVEADVFGKSGTADANIIASVLGIPVIAYGPGNGSGHGPDEYVEVADVVEASRVVEAAIVRICGRRP